MAEQDLNSASDKLVDASEALRELQEGAAADGQVHVLEGVVADLRGRLSKAQIAGAEHVALVKSRLQAEARIAELDDRLGGLPEPAYDIDTAPMKEALLALDEQVAAASTHLTAAQEGYRIEYGNWKEVSTKLEAARRAEAKRTELSARMGTAKQLKKFLSDNRDRYLSSVWDGIMARASSFTSACTDGYISQVVRNANGSFAYIEDGVERPIDAGSGAQRSIMGLGVQLALDALLPCPWQTLLLDEPTADADAQHSLAMATMLAADGKQLIMVSHRELDGAVAQNVIEVV